MRPKHYALITAAAVVALCALLTTSALGARHSSTHAANSSATSPSLKFPIKLVPGSGKGLTIGFIDNPNDGGFISAVNGGVNKAAKIAGVKVRFCTEGGATAATDLLNCVKIFKQAKVDGVILFNNLPATSPRVCSAGPKNVPWIAIITPNTPCAKNFVAINDVTAGTIAGKALGNYAKQNWNCNYDAYVSLQIPTAGVVNSNRMGAYDKGFASVCGQIPSDKYHRADQNGGDTATAQTNFSNILQSLPNAHHIVVTAINDPMMLGVINAARQLGRSSDIVLVGQGGDINYLSNVKNPQWIGDVAYFPEYYGRIAVAALIAKHAKQKVAATLYIPSILLTPKNVNTYYPGTIK